MWFSSDWHFGHTNIAGPKVSAWNHGYRNFESVHEMNKTIIDTINKYVGQDDIIHFLGDFCFGGHKNTPNYRSRINCGQIHVYRGNHDQHIDDYSGLFHTIDDVDMLTFGKTKIFLSHYAHRVWEGSHKGFLHLYGHSHGTIPDFGKSMDVGIDVAYRMFGEYRPFSLEEILKIMDKKAIQYVDHHNKQTNVY